MKIKVITPPAAEPVTLGEVKAALKIDTDLEDITLTPLIKQAREVCEGLQNKKYITQTLDAYLDYFPSKPIEFRDCSPVQSVTSIKYIDCADVEHIVDTATYELDNVSLVNKIDLKYGKMWPTVILKSANGVIIRFIAGYETKDVDLAGNVPEVIKQAIILQVKLLYDTFTDDEQKRIERARDNLLGLERVIPV